MARQNFGFGGGANMQQLMRQAQKMQQQMMKTQDPDDVEMLQDLVMAAVNEALRKGEANREETMNKMAPGMGGMGGLF